MVMWRLWTWDNASFFKKKNGVKQFIFVLYSDGDVVCVCR